MFKNTRRSLQKPPIWLVDLRRYCGVTTHRFWRDGSLTPDTKNHRLVLDGVFWIARTGAQWRDLHERRGSTGTYGILSRIAAFIT